MSETPGILLLDDGELDEAASVLAHLRLPFERIRGGEPQADLPPPRELLITTPRRAESVRRGSPPGGQPGRPVRIIAVEEDSTAMRRMLRRQGFQLLVRLPAHAAVWRLIVSRALYQGNERRGDARVAVGSPVALATDAESREVVLMDISNRGCRLLSKSPFRLRDRVQLEIPARASGMDSVLLSGCLVRAISETAEDGEASHSAAVIFDGSLPDATRMRLASIINEWSMGPLSITNARGGGPAVPPCRSPSIPGLTLDDETDPAIRVGRTVALTIDERRPVAGSSEDRRIHTRGAYESPVVAVSERESRILMGRDLSARGMRVEHLPGLEVGDRFQLALYGPGQSEPYLVGARVIRDDGEDGLALGFDKLPRETARALEKLVACLPDVESLEEGEAGGLGAVISEILD